MSALLLENEAAAEEAAAEEEADEVEAAAVVRERFGLGASDALAALPTPKAASSEMLDIVLAAVGTSKAGTGTHTHIHTYAHGYTLTHINIHTLTPY